MKPPAAFCLWLFLALLAASVTMQWLRARKRQGLVRRADPARLSSRNKDRWNRIDLGFDPLFKDFRKLQLLKKDLSRFPADIGDAWRRYRRLSRLEMAVTAGMVLFALTAFRLCTS